MSNRRTKFYLDKQQGKVMGVCAGIADYTGIDSMWVRIAAVLLVLLGFGLLIPIYLVVGLVADKKPPELYLDQAEERFWQGVRQSPRRSTREVRNAFRDVDHRMSDLEAYYVSSNPRLSAEIDKLR
jgi:phage shock protein C